MSTPIPEPPDGTRLEWTYYDDRYAAWRDDLDAEKSGWKNGDGGEVWCLYGSSMPWTWAQLVADFGESLRDATRLVPVRKVKRGDDYLWASGEAVAPVSVTVTRVAADESWANILCTTGGETWTKRQSLPFPSTFYRGGVTG